MIKKKALVEWYLDEKDERVRAKLLELLIDGLHGVEARGYRFFYYNPGSSTDSLCRVLGILPNYAGTLMGRLRGMGLAMSVANDDNPGSLCWYVKGKSGKWIGMDD
jgi:hypothetical protein